MAGGTSSTLVIHPKGLAAVTMDLDGNDTYIVPLQTLEFNENLRRQIVYEQGAGGEGGAAVGEFGPLVPVTFRVVIVASSVAIRQSDYNTLQAALLNEQGGTIEFKPEGVGVGVESTFYHYTKSGPPKIVPQEKNRWDAGTRSGSYVLVVDVKFMTQPVATSDPDSPATLTEMAATLENWVDDAPAAQSNKVTITAANLKGSLPALLRFMARPGANQYMGRLIVFRRDSGECTLANFVCVYEAEDSANVYPSVAWTSVADATRGDGNYLRCLPAEDANAVAQGRRFTIANPDDHEGRFAVFGVGYDDADTVGVWTHQVKVLCGNVVQAGEDNWEAEHLRTWGLIYCGEFELPPTPLSAAEGGYDVGPYIDWYSTRASGESEFRLDGIILVFVSDSKRQPTALDVMCEDVNLATNIAGVSNSEKLLVENFPDDTGEILELAHVVAQTDDDFKRALTVAPRGDFLTLDPTLDHKLVFVWERALTTILDDDFESYKGSRWMLVADFEADETWVGGAANTVEYAEAAQSRKSGGVSGGTTVYRDQVDIDTVDLESEGRFTDDDFVACAVYLTTTVGVDHIWLEFYDAENDIFYGVFLVGVLATGWNYLMMKKSDFSESATPRWDAIKGLETLFQIDGTTSYASFDLWRVEKADPDDATNPNATGSQWDFQPVGGHWTITEDVTDAGATLACLDVEDGVEKSALIDETTPNDVRFRARVRAKRDAGYVGILWRAGADTLVAGTEDCYAALLDIANDVVLVREYANGAITQHDNPALVSAVDTWYVVGVEAKGSTFRVYATAASNLTDDDDVFDEDYLLSTVTDATLTTGQCGVMSISTLGRFDEAKLTSLQDKHIPADTITLEGKAIWRTIAPFCE